MNDNFMRNLRSAVDRLVPSYTVAHNARGNELVDSGDYKHRHRGVRRGYPAHPPRSRTLLWSRARSRNKG